MKRRNFKLVVVAVLISAVVAGCKKEEKYKDPEETVEFNLTENNPLQLSSKPTEGCTPVITLISWISPDSIVISDDAGMQKPRCSVLDIGTVENLGSITSFPELPNVTTAKCIAGHGYVFFITQGYRDLGYGTYSFGNYMRLYVVSVNANGATVKYQFPFSDYEIKH